MERKTMQLFNLKQSSLFIKQGCKVVDCGIGRKFKVYIEFLVDDNFSVMLKRWHNHEFDVN